MRDIVYKCDNCFKKIKKIVTVRGTMYLLTDLGVVPILTETPMQFCSDRCLVSYIRGKLYEVASLPTR